MFTDFGIYWIHRWEHNPMWYKWLHKPHHKWIVPTPFASYAFHPLDGYFQSIPYHLFAFVFPLHHLLYLGLFVVDLEVSDHFHVLQVARRQMARC